MVALPQNNNIIHIPLNKVWLLNRVKNTKEELEKALERDVDASEIAEHIGINQEKISEVLSFSKTKSLDDYVSWESDSVTFEKDCLQVYGQQTK